MWTVFVLLDLVAGQGTLLRNWQLMEDEMAVDASADLQLVRGSLLEEAARSSEEVVSPELNKVSGAPFVPPVCGGAGSRRRQGCIYGQEHLTAWNFVGAQYPAKDENGASVSEVNTAVVSQSKKNKEPYTTVEQAGRDGLGCFKQESIGGGLFGGTSMWVKQDSCRGTGLNMLAYSYGPMGGKSQEGQIIAWHFEPVLQATVTIKASPSDIRLGHIAEWHEELEWNGQLGLWLATEAATSIEISSSKSEYDSPFRAGDLIHAAEGAEAGGLELKKGVQLIKVFPDGLTGQVRFFYPKESCMGSSATANWVGTGMKLACAAGTIKPCPDPLVARPGRLWTALEGCEQGDVYQNPACKAAASVDFAAGSFLLRGLAPLAEGGPPVYRLTRDEHCGVAVDAGSENPKKAEACGKKARESCDGECAWQELDKDCFLDHVYVHAQDFSRVVGRKGATTTELGTVCGLK